MQLIMTGVPYDFGRIASLAICAVSMLITPLAQAEETAGSIERMRADLTYLSSDELEGRDSGSEGIRKAGEFIRERYDTLGLQTDAFGGSPYQEFTIPGPETAGSGEHNRLSFGGLDLPLPPKLGENFTPLSLGNNDVFEGDVVFAGYGITAPELDYDDYANVDVKGKIVIVIRKEPQQADEGSKFDGIQSSKHALFTAKATNAKTHGVAGMILVNDSATVAGDAGDYLMEADAAGKMPRQAQVPTLFCTRALIDPLIQAKTGKTLEQLEAEIDSDLKPRSQVLEGVTIEGETEVVRSQTPVRNLIAVMPGIGELADEYVVVGAHYDHVGMGGRGSLAPGTIEVHNGADDNGSGTTTILEVARRLSEDKPEQRRTILFISFTGEEKGLLGSKHYVANPRWPLDDTVAMVNLDMVGRLTDNRLVLYGTGTAESFPEMIERLNQSAGFNLDIKPQGTGPSDHASFYAAGMPVFHFFTDLHAQYHRPSDDVELVNFEGMERIATMVTSIVREISTAPQRPKFIGSRVRKRAIVGIQLDMQAETARAAEVSPGGPAESAGMQAGDDIIGIDDKIVETADGLRAVLSKHKPGDEVKVRVKRGDEELELTIRLGAA